MKKRYFFLFIALFVTLVNVLNAGNKDGRILMYARLSANQEVPAITNSKAKGLVTFTLQEDYKTLTILGVFDSLSGPVINCHFHLGFFGANGGIVLNLLPLVKGNLISGNITLTKEILTAINSTAIYINVHTSANPNGEMRGQVLIENDILFAGVMHGSDEVPAVTTSALGLGSFVLSGSETKLEYKVLVTGLSGPIIGAHLHYGEAGKAGPIAYPLSFSGNLLTGTLDVNSAFVDSLFNDLVYVNVHTTANPNGEIRSTLGFVDQVAFDVLANGAGETSPTNSRGKALAIGWLDPVLDTLNYLVLYDSIVPNAGHFHIGAKGVDGGIIIPFTPLVGTPAFIGRAAVKPDTLSKIIKGEVYLNLHTVANPGGEIRGQTSSIIRESMIASLCSRQEVPTNNSSGIGVGLLSFDRNKILGHVEVMTNGLTGNAISGHIHIGAKGVSGGIFVNLGITGATGNAQGGFFNVVRTTFADSLINGLGYYNVHTTLFPNGEIRGQITKTLQDDCNTVSIYEVKGIRLSVKIYPNPMNETVHLDFESNESFEGKVMITDLLGRRMYIQDTKVQRGQNQLLIQAGNLNTGLYFIQLADKNRVLFSERVIKR
ncbi:MAG: CHRD domain-containing protein [Saprospiraceae bacterium]